MNAKIIIISITVILVVVFGGWYAYTHELTTQSSNDAVKNSAPDSTSSISGDLDVIQNDDSIDKGLESLDKDLSSF